MVTRVDVDLVVDARAQLGEGPIWDPRSGRLLWVDIPGQRLHRTDPSGADEAVDLPLPVGAAAVRSQGGLVLATRDGFALFGFDSGAFEHIIDVERGAPTRMNDGKCDRAGRFWAGTMSTEREPEAGALYRLDPDRTVSTALTRVSTSNGLGWSPDDRLMYYNDTPTFRTDVFDYDADAGALSGRRPLVEHGESRPDGLTVDADGCVWVAIVNGSCVRRYTPDGRLDRVVDVPATRVTSCNFGGPGLDQLYITTASSGLSDDQARSEPHAGGLFACRPGVAGQPPGEYAG